ncbi:dTDP-4-amino-4,6-dideoxygalactose transaminase [Agarivorans gilvus]|uniref:dTDP-4-amino-4,6-dideoxygalactose transaminase n=1 Tax=Agarivorans gilvus TaxID=680279 RepID=A0ABQ1I450_9ALTE|nr:dTDP-4-amino-4,6-dideoxygalactose transaminase [Agarivorans gilvus]GGB10541.1 dTDP-4-amino-4,6-dideoxygalactose transaminase [Agarivorans gilvus]
MIPFNRPAVTGNEIAYISKAIASDKISGDGMYAKKCEGWFEQSTSCEKALLTPSCTHALEMMALLIDISPGDEVIIPSYTFVSTANAFVLRGAKIIFVDVDPHTLNLDIRHLEKAITKKTKAIVAVHYAGLSCNMNKLAMIADEHGIYLLEDAAQAIGSYYRSKPLGSFGHLAAYSFHETKNITSGGEGGVLIINDASLKSRAEIIREKGTNRSQYLRGDVGKYTWVDIGSSYLPCELQSAYLWGQLQKLDAITAKRMSIWNSYDRAFRPEKKRWNVILPEVPSECKHNAHIYFIRLSCKELRDDFINFLDVVGICAVFHYVPLHSSIAGRKYGSFWGEDINTTNISDTLVRLPLFYNMRQQDVEKVISRVRLYFDGSR